MSSKFYLSLLSPACDTPRMARTLDAPATVVRKIKLPEELSDLYDERGAKFRRSAEEEIAIRLRNCATHTATQPLYFDDDQRSALSVILNRSISSVPEALHAIRQALTIKVAGVEVTLSPLLLKRLESRCFGKSLPELLQMLVNQTLEEFVGLR